MSQTALAHAPAEPTSIEESGLPETMFEHLILKFLYFRGEMYGKDLSDELGVRFSVIEQLIETLKLRHIVHVKRALGVGNISALLALTDTGRARTRECLEDNQYYGPAPVPMDQYAAMVRQQKPRDGWLTREILTNAYKGMVLTPNILSQIGPAVSSLNSLLIYGKPGNGKTYLIEALANLHTEPIYLPYAIECQGNIVQVYDPIYHTRVEDEQSTELTDFAPTWDRRWCRIKKPFIVSGGELSLDMLDLHFNTTSRIYEAPFQLKANNGVYLVDDFGRQKASPAEVLNRWIVPMERRVDYLSFLTGGKMTVPFETFLVFSTNLNPTDLGDEAFLRRIQYKLLLRGPSEEEFCEIFARFCDGKKLPYTHDMIDRFVDRFYRPTGKEFRRCHPRDLLTHALNLIHFEKLPLELTDDLLDRAFESCFVQDVEEVQPLTKARKAAAAVM